MFENSLVSIIIPTLNRAYLLSETLDSVLEQTYQNWECIVVDDGSTDNTADIMNIYCSKDSRFRYHKRPKDRLPGGNAARNYGFELSRGAYINWFDSDDIMLPEFLKSKINIITKNIDFVICSGSYVDNTLKNSRIIDLAIDTYLYKDYVLWKSHILTPSVLFSKKFLENKELFNVNMLRGQETELLSRLFFRISKNRYKIINESLFLYRQHELTKTNKDKIYNSKYRKSKILNCLVNFEKSVCLKDEELVSFFYKESLSYYFKSLANLDINNSKLIYHRVLPTFRIISKRIYYEFKILGYIFLIINRGSYRIEQRWKKIEL